MTMVSRMTHHLSTQKFFAIIKYCNTFCCYIPSISQVLLQVPNIDHLCDVVKSVKQFSTCQTVQSNGYRIDIAPTA